MRRWNGQCVGSVETTSFKQLSLLNLSVLVLSICFPAIHAPVVRMQTAQERPTACLVLRGAPSRWLVQRRTSNALPAPWVGEAVVVFAIGTELRSLMQTFVHLRQASSRTWSARL